DQASPAPPRPAPAAERDVPVPPAAAAERGTPLPAAAPAGRADAPPGLPAGPAARRRLRDRQVQVGLVVAGRDGRAPAAGGGGRRGRGAAGGSLGPPHDVEPPGDPVTGSAVQTCGGAGLPGPQEP